MKNGSHWVRNVFVVFVGLACLIAISWLNTFTLVQQSRFAVHSIALSLALLLIVSSLPSTRSRLLYFIKTDLLEPYDRFAESRRCLTRFLTAITLIGSALLIWAIVGIVLVPINCVLDRSKATCEEMKVLSKRYDGARYTRSYRALLAPTTLHPEGFEIAVSRASFEAISERKTVLNVCTRRGRLRYEWVSGYSFSSK